MGDPNFHCKQLTNHDSGNDWCLNGRVIAAQRSFVFDRWQVSLMPGDEIVHTTASTFHGDGSENVGSTNSSSLGGCRQVEEQSCSEALKYTAVFLSI